MPCSLLRNCCLHLHGRAVSIAGKDGQRYRKRRANTVPRSKQNGGPRHSSSSFSLASQRGDPGSSLILSSGICDGQSGAGAGFLRVLRFPLPIFIPPNSPSSSQSPAAVTIGHSVAEVPSGPSLDSTHHYAN
jgi:hypothetical protein